MTEIERYLLDLSHTTSLNEAWDAHRDRMATYGFDRLLYGATRFRTENGVGDLADALILTNYPRSYLDAYLDGGLFRDAPFVKWAMCHTGVRSWSEIADDARNGRLTAAEMRVIEFNQRHDVVAGIGISFPKVSLRAGHGIGMCATKMTQEEVDDLWARCGNELILQNQVAHLTFLSLPYGNHGRHLTDRQREVLELIADGKAVGEVAAILGLTGATIDKHLRLAREALDVETTAQAVVKASVQNQIFRFHS